MDHISVDMLRTCEKCGREGRACHSQCWYNGMDEPRTSMSFSCGHCGAAVEEDGTGLTEEERLLFYRQYGIWELRLDCPEGSDMKLARSLQDVLGASAREALLYLKGKNAEWSRGTPVEVECLRGKLAAKGVPAVVAEAVPPTEAT